MNSPESSTKKPDLAVSDGETQQRIFTQRPFLMMGGVGCGILLCAGLLFGSTFLFFGNSVLDATSGNEPPAEAEIEVVGDATNEDEATDGEPVEASQTTELRKNETVSDTLNNSEPNKDKVEVERVDLNEQGQRSPPGTPEMGPITFTLEREAGGAASTGSPSFAAGVQIIQAGFTYANVTPEHTWTQVWYQDEAEIFRISQAWLEAEAGVFDYSVEAGGDPLPPGRWRLDFYIDDSLLTTGNFIIETEDEAAEAGQTADLADLPKLYRLAYPKWNGEKHDLYLGDTLGRSEQFVMSRVAGPSWSPDGQYIFFYGEEGVDQQVINGAVYPLPNVSNGIARLTVAPFPADISQVQIFQGHGWNDGTARWANIAPNGSMIAYDGDRGGGRRIYFLGSGTNQQFRYEIIGEQADWSPDSRKIAYRSGRDNRTGIWISNRDDSGHTLITTGGTDSFPAWSPDGKRIAFSREVGGNVDIYTVKSDGSDLVRLTDAPGHDTLPVYAPNGDLIFRSARNGSWAIWKMQGDGSGQTQIIGNAPVGPEWSFSRMSILP